MPRSLLDIYGETVAVDCPEAVKRCLEHDFHYFLRPPAIVEGTHTTFRLKVRLASERPTDWKVLFKTQRSQIFWSPRNERRVCFFKECWVNYRFEERRAEIYASNPEIAYEGLYLVILSYVGERLDRRGLHRLHGLALSRGKSGAVVLAGSGVGKSTLAWHLLSDSAISILSDDVPLVSRGAQVRAFPQRIALAKKPAVSDRYLRKFPRALHATKYVVGGEYFKGKVRRRASLRYLILFSRKERGKAEMRAIPRSRLAYPLLKWLVMGMETPQIWELFLRPSPSDVLAKVGIGISRCRVALELGLKASPLELKGSGNPNEFARVLRNFRRIPA